MLPLSSNQRSFDTLSHEKLRFISTSSPTVERQEQTPADSTPSIGHIHPAIISAEGTRQIYEANKEVERMKNKPFLRPLFYGNKNLHEAVENAPFIVKLRANKATKEEYGQYLINLHEGFQALEGLLKTAVFPHKEIFNFEPFYRTDALEHDIEALKLTDLQPYPFIKMHIAHYIALKEINPKLLIVHTALRYFAILHGGQQRADRLLKMWGPNFPIRFYQFPKPPETMLQDLIKQLDAFEQTFVPGDKELFSNEIKFAWVFAGDILEVDIRPLLKLLPVLNHSRL